MTTGILANYYTRLRRVIFCYAVSFMAVAATKRRVVPTKKEPFPWLIFFVLVGSVYLFWVLPMQIGSPAPHVTFQASSK